MVLIRRSLLVSGESSTLQAGPDAVVLGATASRDDIDRARSLGAEVLLRHTVGHSSPVPSGVAGLVVTADTAGDLEEPMRRLAATDTGRADDGRTVELLPVIASPLGVWRAREIATFPGVRQVGFHEDAFVRHIGAAVAHGVDPCIYARGRVVTEALVAGAEPICWVASLDSPTLFNSGYRGFMIEDPRLAARVNDALTPSPEDVSRAEQVRDAFTAGLAAGTAAVRLGERMIDVPVYKAALGVLDRAEACAARNRITSVGPTDPLPAE